MRVNLTNTDFPIKVASFECLKNVLIQSTVGSGTLVRIAKNKNELEQITTSPLIGLTINPDNGIYSFCWQGDLYAMPVGGTMFLDVEFS